jgi:aryl sulfotransferase
MSGIVWLASFPKSGNTWFRAFLANLIANRPEPVAINELGYGIFESRQTFDAALGWETSDLPAEAVNRLRPQVQDVLARGENVFFKTHEAFTHPQTGEPLFSLGATRAALYFIRNPLDVAVSFGIHIGKDTDAAIERMNDRATQIFAGSDKLRSQLAQPLGDWSGHVRSWVDAPGLRVQVVRFEDMLARTGEVFTSACRFAGLPDEPARVARALAHSSFKELQRQERAKGFAESAQPDTPFFRSGRAGGWRDILSSRQVDRIVESHSEVMRRFGYLGPDGSCL